MSPPSLFPWRARLGVSIGHLAVGSLLLRGQALWHSLVFGPCEEPSDVSLSLNFPSCLASGAQGA